MLMSLASYDIVYALSNDLHSTMTSTVRFDMTIFNYYQQLILFTPKLSFSK